jgi:hypothetical protein
MSGWRADAAEAVELALALDPKSAHHLEVTTPGAGVWELKTTGVDPFIATLPFPEAPLSASVLTFEYVCMGIVKQLEVFVGFPWSESQAQTADELPYSEGWTTFALDLRPARARAKTPPTRLRIDFGREPDRVIQLRNVRLRAPDPREEEIERRRVARLAADRALDAEIQQRLGIHHRAVVQRVAVRPQEIEIAGDTGGEQGEIWLAESPIWQHLSQVRRFERAQRIATSKGGAFTVVLPRRVTAAGGERDRLHSRWLLIRAGEVRDELISAARYADAVASRHEWPREESRSKKGLGGFQVGRPSLVRDLDDLGITSVTVNLFLSSLLRSQASTKTAPFRYNGRGYQVDRAELERLDRTMLAAAARRALVFGILLVGKAETWDTPALGRRMQHPDCEPAGIYSMANVTSAEGVEHYSALLDFLAERYSRPEQTYGRIHHWIVHNEVDAGWTWTNCGEKPPVLFMDQYHKSMRLSHLIARQYDPQARAYISLTHYWTWTANFRYTPSRELLRHLLAFSRVEGDFDWGIAFHPYPESLREPKTWLDRQATFAFETPLITFKNIEVLNAWVKLPAQRYLGRHVRSVHLTEQGPNSRDYTPQALAEQAASMAYVWKKIRGLDAIEGYQFHNWIDNRREGGLRIGLRRFPDDSAEPLGPKPVWHVYRALDTPEEDAACAFALPIIGVRSWDEVPYRGKITGEP